MDPKISDFILTFSSVLWEAMPFIVLGAVIAGFLEEFLPQEAISKFLPRAVLPSVMIGAVLGLIFPMCECGIVVVMRRLLRKGLPLSCCIAYMLAGPVINGVVIYSTWVAFRDFGIGREMVGLRILLAFIVACLTGLIVQRQYQKYGNALLTPMAMPPAMPESDARVSESNLSWLERLWLIPIFFVKLVKMAPKAVLFVLNPRTWTLARLSRISATALHDFVDITVFLILGAVLAAIAKQNITPDQIESLSRDQPFLAIPAMMLLAVLMCLCSEADAFVAASFTNMHVSAKLAFLVLGPMLDLKLLMMFTRVFRLRLIVTIVLSTVCLVFILTLAVHGIYELNHWSGLPTSLQPGALK
ncbi:MAG TPA: permease [Gemmata sp.]|nr:permease [Gemmata sp.]